MPFVSSLVYYKCIEMNMVCHQYQAFERILHTPLNPAFEQDRYLITVFMLLIFFNLFLESEVVKPAINADYSNG